MSLRVYTQTMKMRSRAETELEALAALKPLPRSVLSLYRAFEEEFLGALRATPGLSSITVADHDVLRFIGPSGSTIVDIARKNGVSKQAASQAVASLVARGLLAKQANAADGRSQIVVFTVKGAGLVARAVSIVKGIEARYEKLLGRAELERTKASLRVLIDDHQKRGDRI